MSESAFKFDTTPEAAAVMRQVLHRIGFEGRARMTFELMEMGRKLSEEGVRYRHPNYTARQVRLGAIRLAIGNELFRQAYPGEDIES